MFIKKRKNYVLIRNLNKKEKGQANLKMYFSDFSLYLSGGLQYKYNNNCGVILMT